MVVVLIVSVLIAVAIPTFAGAQNRTRDRQVQANLRIALTAAKVLATESDGRFEIDGNDLEPADLEEEAPFAFGSIGSAGQSVMGVRVESSGNVIVLEMQSASGSWFGMSARSNGRVEYCEASAPTGCDRSNDRGFSGVAW